MASDLIIRFLGDTSEFNAKLDQTEAKLAQFGKSAEKSGATLTDKLAIAGVTAVAAVGIAAIGLADKFDVVHARLETATKNVGENFDDFKGKVEQTDQKMAGLGFSSIDTEDSLAKLTAATKNVGTATNLMGLAADIARGRHIGLSQATDILVKVETGHVALLGRLGIATKDSTGKTITQTEAIKRLTDLYGGQGTAYTKTLAGEFDVLKANLTNAGVAIGEKLMPWVNSLVGGIAAAIEKFQGFNDATNGVAGKLLAVGAIAPFAIAGLMKLVEIGGLVGSTFTSMAESAYLWVLLNPELAAIGAAAAVAGAALLIFGHHAHEAAVAVQELTNAELDKQLEGYAAAINEFNQSHPGVGFKEADVALAGFNNALKEGVVQGQRYIDAMKAAGLDTSQETDILKKRIQAQKETDAAQTKLNSSTQASTPLTQAQIQAQKQLTDSLTKYGQVAGPVAEGVVKSLHMSKDAIDALTSSTKAMNDSIATSFNAAGNTIDAWEQKSSFDLKQFESDLLKQEIAQANWANNIKILSDAGINQGFLKTLVDAGPKSAVILQGLASQAKSGAVDQINSILSVANGAVGAAQRSSDAAMAGLRGDFANFGAYINALNPHLTITAGVTLQSGGTTIVRSSGVTLSALGGERDAGQPLWVGERGPEVFVPKVPGRVVPNANIQSFRGGGAVVNLTVNVYNPENGNAAVDQVVKSLNSGRGRLQLKQALGLPT